MREYARRKCGEAVVCLGTRGDIADLYADLDLVIHPSHSENVGGAVESLLLARPTITTNIGGFPDLIKDGVTGYLVPPKKPDPVLRSGTSPSCRTLERPILDSKKLRANPDRVASTEPGLKLPINLSREA